MEADSVYHTILFVINNHIVQMEVTNSVVSRVLRNVFIVFNCIFFDKLADWNLKKGIIKIIHSNVPIHFVRDVLYHLVHLVQADVPEHVFGWIDTFKYV